MPSFLPPAFHRLAWSNLAAQSAEQRERPQRLGLLSLPLLAAIGFIAANTDARPIGGAIGAAYGPASFMIVTPAGFALQALIILCSPVPQLERLSEAIA
jgi:hypothetical protein